jgi:hypothetical protein
VPAFRLLAHHRVIAVIHVADSINDCVFDAAMSNASTGTLWFLPTQKVLQPASRRTVAVVAFERGVPVVTRKAARGLSDRSKAVLMMIAPGEKARARRRADRGRVPLPIGQFDFSLESSGRDCGSGLREANILQESGQVNIRRYPVIMMGFSRA